MPPSVDKFELVTWQLRVKELHWRVWEGEIAVFNGVTGNTHAFNALGTEVFEALCTGAADVATIVRRVAETTGVSNDAEFATAVELMLRQFQGFRLIQPLGKPDGSPPAEESVPASQTLTSHNTAPK